MPADNPQNSNVIDLSRILRDKEAEIELLQETFTEIGSELDLGKIFQIVSERARELIGAETLLIPLVDHDQTTYTYRGGSGKNAKDIIGESMPINFGVCGWVWEHKKPWWRGVLEDLSEDERLRWNEEAGTMILVPLQGKRQFLGGIAGINKVDGGEFSKRELNLLQLFASIVSIAIENALAVQNMEASNRLNDDYRLRLETLNKQLIESSKELEYLSLYDTVTSLPNRSLFHDRLTRYITYANLNDEPVGLLLVDLDRFKEINEALGHDRGDLLLKKIARRFNENIKSNETLARLGGDEFVIILPGHDEDRSIKRAQDFLSSLETSFNVDNNKIAVNASVGVSLFPQHGDDISSLLSHADSAMYEAKKSSLGVSLYDPDTDHLTTGHLAMLAELRKALEEKHFELHYQPKVSIRDNRIVSAEALGRWSSSVRGSVPPAIFINMLEQNGMIDEYTYWAIETALDQAMRWDKAGGRIRIAVNVSPQTLMHPDFMNKLEVLVRNSDRGSLLIFEITENLFLSEYERLSEVLDYICHMGIGLSIDDYGTGYSSLSRLRRLPLSELKIDQSFVKDMIGNKDDEAVVHSTIELAHNLGMVVVAEGVEKLEALELLDKLGCDIAQGFLISKPLPVADFDRFLQDHQT